MSDKSKEKLYINWLRQNPGNSSYNRTLYENAWKTARKAAKILKEKYNVERIRVFGSLIHEERFHSSSDIDLAVEGLASSDYWKALTSVIFLDDKLSIDMIDKTLCKSEIWDVVEREGIDL